MTILLVATGREPGVTVKHQDETLNRAKLRADIASKRARGESIALKSLQDEEWEKQDPGVDFILRGDAYSGVIELSVNTPSGPQHIGRIGGLRFHHLHLDPVPGTYTYFIRMDEGSRTITVPVRARQLTRVIITLREIRTERSAGRITRTYDASIKVEEPHPAGTLP